MEVPKGGTRVSLIMMRKCYFWPRGMRSPHAGGVFEISFQKGEHAYWREATNKNQRGRNTRFERENSEKSVWLGV